LLFINSRLMKQFVQFFCISICLAMPFLASGQASVVCGTPIQPGTYAGVDQTICAPNCATLTGTFVPTFQTNTYAVGTIPYAPDPFTVGTSITLSDDAWSPIIPLPFTFCFFGIAYNSCIIGSNGTISFTFTGTYNTANGGFDPYSTSAAIPNTGVSPRNAIFGCWQDLYPPSGGTIKYTTYGTAPCRRFVVSWNAVPQYSCFSVPSTQQIILYETTNIIDNFIQSKPICASWSVGAQIQGIQNAAGTIAVVVPGRNYPSSWSANNDGKRYTPTGAVPTYAISWWQGATLLSNTASTVVCPTTTTTYTFQTIYTNCNGINATLTDQVVVNVNTLVTTAGPDQNICLGGCATLTGNAAGATSYAWTTIPGNTNVGNTATINPCPTVTTTYVVTATSPVCSGTDTVIVNVASMTTANAGPDDSICTGSCTTLQGSGGVTYSWAPAGSITGPSNIANPQACPTTTTQYTVTVTNAAGCIGTDSVIVYVAPVPLSLNITPSNPTCFGYCNGSATSAPAGGYPPYTYSWSNGQLTPNAINLCPGPISLTVTDAIGCTATATALLTQPTAVQITATNITTANCGQSDGTVTISVSGGTPGPGYTVLWPATGNSGLTESNLPPGQVCVYAYDANGCGDTLCVNVPNTPGAVVNVTSFTNVTCNGACDGTAIALAAGGTSPYNYSWNTAPVQPNDTASNLCPGTYTVTMTDANGCTNTNTVTITEPAALTHIASGATTICIGQSANLSDVPAGGTPAYIYNWTDGTTNWATANISVSPTVTTTYTISVTDAHGCLSTDQIVTVTVNPPLNVVAMAGITVCANTPVTLNALANGGNGVLNYNWQPGNLNGSSVNTSTATTTTYTVTVTDGCGTPFDSDTVTVTINPNPTVTFAATSATSGCMPLCVDFVNTTPNTASISWNFGNLGTSTLAAPSFCFPAFGSYDISAIVTDNIGCVGTATMTNLVTVWPLPTADFSASPQPATILDNQVTFTDLSNGAVAWIWSFGADDSASVLQNPVYAFQDSGTYNVQLIVTNQYGCQDNITMPIVVHPDFAVYIPNSFTPNGDGKNDIFYPLGMGVNPEQFSMIIFDRWGNVIYKTDVWPGGWDGTVQGTSQVCQVDTYVYKITTYDPDGSRKVYIGQINLIR
jgi:gliding motility-associated-like protein